MDGRQVFMGTSAGVRMLGGGFNSMAETPIAMLVREFEWDYVAVRCQFVSVFLILFDVLTFCAPNANLTAWRLLKFTGYPCIHRSSGASSLQGASRER